ncbi:hypothetical protein [Bifidobacterium stellenboschense]|uniref:Uncharacterized protein n=1 Tax=Bifidobacterium stellenboschense TaxID=762211 RepID=A0A087DQR4_9BIFI|nr:hypothetical protein [Bifidobacterium stellenboschense]KFI97864.1 hypothetical protein BSTEL_0675 [Bifidobacterium stellenboschense]
MAQVTELLNAIGEFLKGLGATLAPIATVAIFVMSRHDEPKKPKPPRKRRRRR